MIARDKDTHCEHDKRWSVFSQRDLASALGIDESTVARWVKDGLARWRGGKNRYRYCIPCSCTWERNRRQCDMPQIADELLTVGSDSPNLERLRLAKAKLAELELDRQEGNLLPREKVRSGLGRFAAILRQLGERLGKRHGPEVFSSVNDALDDCQRVIDDEFGSGSDLPDDAA